MSKRKAIPLCSILALALCGQQLVLSLQGRQDSSDTVQSPRIVMLKTQISSGNRPALDQFWADVGKAGTPLIEPISADGKASWVTFLWKEKGETRNVVLISDMDDPNDVSTGQMAHLQGTDVWYRTYRIRNDARFTYRFSINDSLRNDRQANAARVLASQADPLNSHKVVFTLPPGLAIPFPSLLEMPAARPQPWIVPSGEVAKGTVEQTKIASALMKNDRNVWVYTPPGFNAKSADYPLLLAFDGLGYIERVPTPVILDNLIAQKRIPPIVAVVLDNPIVNRNSELMCSTEFVDFLTKEVVPWMRIKYAATNDPAKTIIAGSSLGGLTAAFAALRHSEVFGNVLSESGSFFWRPEADGPEAEWLTSQFVNVPRLQVRFFLEAGLMEDRDPAGAGVSLLVSNRHLRDVLSAKGYAVHYQEFNGGHQPINWRGGIADGLQYLLAR